MTLQIQKLKSFLEELIFCQCSNFPFVVTGCASVTELAGHSEANKRKPRGRIQNQYTTLKAEWSQHRGKTKYAVALRQITALHATFLIFFLQNCCLTIICTTVHCATLSLRCLVCVHSPCRNVKHAEADILLLLLSGQERRGAGRW